MKRRALLIGGAVLLVAPQRALAVASQGEATAYLLDLEAAQVALYKRARELPLKGRASALAGRFYSHETAHLARLRDILSGTEPQPATFTFGNAADFLKAAQRLEALAVSGYNGAIPTLADKSLRAELAGIAQTEARHAAAIRDLRSKPPAPRAYDPGVEGAKVQRALAALVG
jgi:rubrerythrin